MSILTDTARGVEFEVLEEGDGDPVVLLPSAQRGAADFTLLQTALSAAGYRSIAVNLRGAGRSTPPPAAMTLRDHADDVAFVIRQVASGPAHVVGHALGNVVARATASYRPEVVASVVVMPCGGHSLATYPVADEVLSAFSRCHDRSLSREERLEALQTAFFAPGNDPSPWLNGWWPSAGSGAIGTADPDEWWHAGDTPLLIVQPLDDAMAPIGVGRDAAAALGRRATYVEIPHCGHAILPEQPDLVAQHVIDFLRAQPAVRP
ncbi:MAG: alpha/beta hydrolase [Actinomycetota bacterium]|nr:alpha/beta hydrolase [Actinomycetota bacterium]